MTPCAVRNVFESFVEQRPMPKRFNFFRFGCWLFTPVLFFMALVYGALLKLRSLLWQQGILKSRRLDGLVISVGNIEVGGTGKSPVVISLCRYLVQRGRRPVILTRGYGVSLGRRDFMILVGGRVVAQSQEGLKMPDEARMQSLQLPEVPVVVGPRRWNCAQRFLQHRSPGLVGNDASDTRRTTQPTVTHWVLDDGFQHWTIERQWDLVLLSGTSPQARRLLPWGRLREPLGALRRADVLFFTRMDPATATREKELLLEKIKLKDGVETRPVSLKAQPIGRSVDWAFYGLSVDPGSQRQVEFAKCSHLPAFLLSGIAKPKRFIEDFLGLYDPHSQNPKSVLSGSVAVGDHRRFSLDHLLVELQKKDVGSIVTTEKDLARDPQMFYEIEKRINKNIFVMKLELVDEKELWDSLRILEK